MKNYPSMWLENILQRQYYELKNRISIIGLEDKILGPMRSKAKIKMTVERSDEFEIVDKVPINKDLIGIGFPECVIFGLLDVLLVDDKITISKMKIILEEVEFDEINSSNMAFRKAARNAGLKILDEMEIKLIN